ncbi:hypothetical protein [Phocaeicola sp.]
MTLFIETKTLFVEMLYGETGFVKHETTFIRLCRECIIGIGKEAAPYQRKQEEASFILKISFRRMLFRKHLKAANITFWEK